MGQNKKTWKGIYRNMGNIKNDNNGGDGAVNETTKANNTEVEPITMSKADYDKAIQSAEDKVRGKMSKTIKELEAKIKELTPEEKSQEQIELENRLAQLEESEKAIAEKQRRLEFQEKLSDKGLNKKLVDYLNDNVDIEAFSDLIQNIMTNRAKSNGYVPVDHSSDSKISQEDFAKMTYSQKVELQRNHPETYRRLSGRR